MESFEHVGVWWLPSEPNHYLFGTLSFDHKTGPVLDVMGDSFGELKLRADRKNTRLDIILGMIKGAQITLRDCIVTSIGFSMPGFHERRIRISAIYKGHHFEQVEDIKFEAIFVNYSYLNEWMGQNNFAFKSEYEVKYTPFKFIDAYINETKVRLRYNFQHSESRDEVNFRQTGIIIITPTNEAHIDDYFQLINFHLPNFLSLATGEMVYPQFIHGKSSSTSKDIEILYPIYGFSNLIKQITHNQMLFTLDDIADDFSMYLSNWLTKSEKLLSVYELYFKLLYIKSLDIKTKFLLLAQALETYHRESYGGQYITPEEYEPIEKALIDAIPELVDKSHKDKLKGMIHYGYEYSLRKRLKSICNDILSDYSEIVLALFGSVNDFANNVTSTRNSLTHHPKNPDKHSLSDSDIHIYVRKMQLLLQVCFLVELELSPDKIKILISNNQKFQVWLD